MQQKAMKEFQTVKKLEHENIIKALDFYIDPVWSQTSYVMSYPTSISLAEYSKETEITEIEAIKLFKNIMEALVFVHKNKICHRDINPNNVLVSR